MAASIRGLFKMGQQERTTRADGVVKRKQSKQGKASASPTSSVNAGLQLHVTDCAPKSEAAVLRAIPETNLKNKMRDSFWNLASQVQSWNLRLVVSAKSINSSRALRGTIVAIVMVIPSLCLGDKSVLIFYVFSCICLGLGGFAKSGLRRPFAASPQKISVALKLRDTLDESETPDELHDSTSPRCADGSTESGLSACDTPRSGDGSAESEPSTNAENLTCPNDAIHHEARVGIHQEETQRGGVGCDGACEIPAVVEMTNPTMNLVSGKMSVLASSETQAEDETTIPAKNLVEGKMAAPVPAPRLSWVDLDYESDEEGWRVTQPKFPENVCVKTAGRGLAAAAVPKSSRTAHLDDGCDVAQPDVPHVASCSPQGKAWWADMDSSDDERSSDWLERGQDGKPKKWSRR
jgi:hypothetical protein